MPRAAAPLVLALVLAIGGAAACGDDGDDNRGGESPSAPSGGPLVELLAQIPDTDETQTEVILNDFGRAAEAADLEPPDPDADEEELLDYFLEITGGRDAPVATLPNELTGRSQRGSGSEEEWRDEIGFAFSDVDRSAAAGLPPETIQVFEGRIDGEAVEDAVRNDETWSDLLEDESHEGVDFYSWGDDDEVDPDRFTPARPLGRGGQLLVDEPIAVFTNGLDTMESVIETRVGNEPSLADDDTLVELATAMEDLEAYSVYLSGEPVSFEGDLLPPGEADDLEELALAPYSAYATGGAVDGDDPVLLIALAHDDAEAAGENADRLERLVDEGESVRGAPWSEIVEVDEITVDGTLLTARFRIVDAAPTLWIQIVTVRDTLLATAD